MEFSRQEYWSMQTFHFPGDLSNSVIEPRSPVMQADSLQLESPGTPKPYLIIFIVIHCRRRQWHPTPVLLPGKSHGWRSLVDCSRGVTKSQTWLNDFTFTFHFHALEKEMATHSGVLNWRIPGTGAPGGLPSMGSHRVGHNWSHLAAAAIAATSRRCQNQSIT